MAWVSLSVPPSGLPRSLPPWLPHPTSDRQRPPQPRQRAGSGEGRSSQAQLPFWAVASGLRVRELGPAWELLQTGGWGMPGHLGLAGWRSRGLEEAWESDTDRQTRKRTRAHGETETETEREAMRDAQRKCGRHSLSHSADTDWLQLCPDSARDRFKSLPPWGWQFGVDSAQTNHR